MSGYTPKSGHSFISISSTYDNIPVYRIIEDDSTDPRVKVCFYDKAQGPSGELTSAYLDEIQGPFFPLLWGNRKVDDLVEIIAAYNSMINDLEEILLHSTNNSIPIESAINRLIGMNLRDRDETVLLLKVLIAEHVIVEYKELSTGSFIRFTDSKRREEHSKQYYSSIAREITVKSERVDLLISHGQTVGNFREYILRELLKRHLPARFAVATGFIEDISKQIDIIIYDSQNFYPTFKEGDLVVVRREAVRAIIEVKSTLNTNTLNDSLDSFYNILRPGLFRPELPLFKGIFAFDTDYVNTESIGKAINKFYTQPFFVKELGRKITRSIDYLYQEVSCVTVVKKHFLFSAYEPVAGSVGSNFVPSVFSISNSQSEDIQTTMFLAMLFNYLDVDYYAKKTMMRAFSKVYGAERTEVVCLAKLAADDWFPSTRRDGEHDGSVQGVRDRIEKIGKWLEGETTTTEYLREMDLARKVKK